MVLFYSYNYIQEAKMLCFAQLDSTMIQQMDALFAIMIAKLVLDQIIIIAIHANKQLSPCIINMNVFRHVRIARIRFQKNIHEHARLVTIQIVKYAQMVVIRRVFNVLKVH